MNCQSLKTKIKSLSENFKNNKNAVVICNETWFKTRDPQLKKILVDLEDEEEVVALRKDRKQGKRGLAHGGVAVFFDRTKCNLKKIPLNALRGQENRDFEILAARGNLSGVKRELVVFSCYLPPSLGRAQAERIIEALTDAISEAKAKANSPWMIIAGDWDKHKTDLITNTFPDLTVRQTAPTRGLATLDLSLIHI